MDEKSNVRGNNKMVVSMLSNENKDERLKFMNPPKQTSNRKNKKEERFLYNEEKKVRFLTELLNNGNINEGTARNYYMILTNVYKDEVKLGKDLSEFTFEELEQVLHGLNSVSRNAIESYSRILSKYLAWCGDNKLSILSPKDFSKYMVAEDYFTEKQLRRLEDKCENYQDAVILRLLFIGVNGNASSELRNLKATDVDFDKKIIKLYNDSESDQNYRYLDVDDYTLNLIEGAIRQRKYAKKNGRINQTESNNISPYTDLVENQYVIRPSITQNESFTKPVDKFTVYRRIDVLEEVAEEVGIYGLKPKYIQRSGMIYLAHKLAGNNDVTLSHIKTISNPSHFNVRSFHNIKSFVTKENIQKTYGQSENDKN